MSTTESEKKHVQRFYIYPDGELHCHFEGEKTHWPIPEKLQKRLAQEACARLGTKLTYSAIVSGKYFPDRTPPGSKPIATRLTEEEKAARKDARMADRDAKKALIKKLAALSLGELETVLADTQMSQAAD